MPEAANMRPSTNRARAQSVQSALLDGRGIDPNRASVVSGERSLSARQRTLWA
jgi:hypothetical protein